MGVPPSPPPPPHTHTHTLSPLDQLLGALLLGLSKSIYYILDSRVELIRRGRHRSSSSGNNSSSSSGGGGGGGGGSSSNSSNSSTTTATTTTTTAAAAATATTTSVYMVPLERSKERQTDRQTFLFIHGISPICKKCFPRKPYVTSKTQQY